MNIIKQLHDKTGCSFILCKKAIQYAEEHPNCTPEGFLKASTYAVKWEDFDKKVEFYSKKEN